MSADEDSLTEDAGVLRMHAESSHTIEQDFIIWTELSTEVFIKKRSAIDVIMNKKIPDGLRPQPKGFEGRSMTGGSRDPLSDIFVSVSTTLEALLQACPSLDVP